MVDFLSPSTWPALTVIESFHFKTVVFFPSLVTSGIDWLAFFLLPWVGFRSYPTLSSKGWAPSDQLRRSNSNEPSWKQYSNNWGTWLTEGKELVGLIEQHWWDQESCQDSCSCSSIGPNHHPPIWLGHPPTWFPWHSMNQMGSYWTIPYGLHLQKKAVIWSAVRTIRRFWYLPWYSHA